MNKFIKNPIRGTINILMATGVIPYALSMVFYVILTGGFLNYKIANVIVYSIPTIVMIVLAIFKFCNPLTMLVGHMLFLFYTPV